MTDTQSLVLGALPHIFSFQKVTVSSNFLLKPGLYVKESIEFLVLAFGLSPYLHHLSLESVQQFLDGGQLSMITGFGILQCILQRVFLWAKEKVDISYLRTSFKRWLIFWVEFLQQVIVDIMHTFSFISHSFQLARISGSWGFSVCTHCSLIVVYCIIILNICFPSLWLWCLSM